MSFSPIKGSEIIARHYKRYLRTMFRLNDEEYNSQFMSQIESQETLVAGPYLDAHDNFDTGSTTRQLIKAGILPEDFQKLGFHHDRSLYAHQEMALRKALKGKNLVVSTGTGSGKTECFLMPIMASLAKEAQEGTLTPGVRALLIYPMNALANDQVERLRGLLGGTKITFGCYTGQTLNSTSKALADYKKLNEDREPLPNELISREQMKETPPNILITNYAMLEYLMVRPGDHIFFQSDTWKYIVLDEAHIYRGSTGIEVSMLLRRLKSMLTGCSLQFFLTSATLGDEENNGAVVEFAQNLCGEEFFEEDIIRAKRKPVPRPDSFQDVPSKLYQELAEMIDQKQPKEKMEAWIRETYPQYVERQGPSLFELVRSDKKYWRLREILKIPTTVWEISRELSLDEEELENLVKVASYCEEEGVRLLDSRYHTFLRATDSAFITLPPCKKLFLTRRRDYQPSPDSPTFKVFEIQVCTSCHAIYLTGTVKEDLTSMQEEWNQELYYLGEENEEVDEDDQRAEGSKVPGKICAICGEFYRSDVKKPKSCVHPEKYKVPVVRISPKRQKDEVRPILRKCACCGAVRNYGVLRSFFTGQEAVTSVLATSLFNALPSTESAPISETKELDEFGFQAEESNPSGQERGAQLRKVEAKQFLCFSDSRQASAFFATYLNTTYQRLLYRRFLCAQLEELKGPIPLTFFCEDVQAKLEGMSVLGEDFRPEKESWKAFLSEAADMRIDNSLFSMGLMGITLKPGGCKPNPMLNLSAQEVEDLLNMLVGTLVNSLAIRLPVSMTEADKEFYAYGVKDPVFVPTGGDSDKGIINFVPTGEAYSNRRLDYCMRVLEKKNPQNGEKVYARKLLLNLFTFISRTYDPFTEVAGEYQLDPQKLYVYRPDKWYRCDSCHKVTSINISGVCTTYRCRGTLREIDLAEELKDNHYYRLSQDMEMRPLRVREHTAQLDRNTAYKYQKEFKQKELDVLSCSTTFEMGVDLGDLETVLMRNMPPSPSNYAQRAGRAGRSRNAAAFALTFCNRSNHDFAFFNHPTDMIQGKIHAPHFNILNEKIAIRHLYASVFAFFWRKYPGYFHNVQEMRWEQGQEDNGFHLLKSYLDGHPEDLRLFLKRFLPGSLYETFECDTFGFEGRLLDPQEGVLTQAVEEYNYEIQQLEDARKKAYEANRSTGYFENRLRNYRFENILGFLSRKNVIPKYGFPVDTVGMNIITKKEQEKYGVELQRDLAMAISEYAPDSQVVANGTLFTGRYIRRVPSIGWKMYNYSYCEKCNSLNIDVYTKDMEGEQLSECQVCKEELTGAKKTFLIPSFGFEADPNCIKKPTLQQPERTYRSEVSYVGYRANVELLEIRVGNSRAAVRFSEKDEMAVLNTREFFVCETCGYGEISKEGSLSTKMVPHIRKDGGSCSQKRLRSYSIGYRFETDVFLIFFPDYPIPYWDKRTALSVLYALLRGIIDSLDLEDSDVAACLQSTNGVQGGGYGFLFYDKTPGGAGHMRRLQEEDLLVKSLQRGYELMKECTCGGEEGHSSCYSCLRRYENQKVHQILERRLAINYIGQILGING